MTDKLERRIVAILAADIAQYSRLVAEDEEETLRRLANYRAVFDDFINQFGGRIFNTAGDAVLVEFKSAVDAVRCAVDVQESLRARNAAYPASRRMSYRMGITIGDVVEREGDLLGEGVNIAARLESVAPVGGVCVSHQVYEAVQNKLSVNFDDLGQQQLKNIPNRVHAFSLNLQTRPSENAESKLPHLQQYRTIAIAIGALLLGLSGAYFFLDRKNADSNDIPIVANEPAASTAVLNTKQDVAAGKSEEDTAARPPVASPKPVAPEAFSSDHGRTDSQKTADGKAAAGTAKDQSGSGTVQENNGSKISGQTADAETEDRLNTDKLITSKPHVADPKRTDRIAIDTVIRNKWRVCLGSEGNKDYEKIIEACRSLIANNWVTDKDVPTVLIEEGRAYRELGEVDKAIQLYTDSLERAETAEAYNQRGIAYFKKRDWNDAVDDFSSAIRIAEDNGEYRNNRAWTLFKSGRSREALTDADAAVASLKGKAYPLDTRGHIHEALGNRKEAISDYRAALKIDPKLKASRDGLRRLAR